MKNTTVKEMLNEKDYNYLLEITVDQMNREVFGLITACAMLPKGVEDVLNYQRCKEMISQEDYDKTIKHLATQFLNGSGIRENKEARYYLEDCTDLYLSFCLFPIKEYLEIPKDVRKHVGRLSQDFIDGAITPETFEEGLYSTEMTLRAFGNRDGANALGTLRVEALDLEEHKDEALNMMTHYED